VEQFEATPVPSAESPADLDAARALLTWLTHPYVCSGGALRDQYLPPYLASLISEVEHLRAVEAAARTLIENDNERKWDAMKAVPARDELCRLLNFQP
jgi:hypothetical protein